VVHHGMHKCDPGKDVVIDFMKLKTVFTLISTKMLFRFFQLKPGLNYRVIFQNVCVSELIH